MKKKMNLLTLMIFIQINAIGIFLYFCGILGEQQALFEGVKEFKPVSIKCIASEGRSYGTYKNRMHLHCNTYEYQVEGKTYTRVYYAEKTAGKDKILYYNPNNPEILSKYSSYSNAVMSNFGWILLAAFAQGVVVVYFLRVMQKSNNKTYMHEATQSVGVVLEDDYDFIFNQSSTSAKNDDYSK